MPAVHPVDDVLPLPKLVVLGLQPVVIAIVLALIRADFGLIPMVSPTFLHTFPDALKPVVGDGIILTSIAAVGLNAFFNRTSREQAEADAFVAAQAAEHF